MYTNLVVATLQINLSKEFGVTQAVKEIFNTGAMGSDSELSLYSESGSQHTFGNYVLLGEKKTGAPNGETEGWIYPCSISSFYCFFNSSTAWVDIQYGAR